MTEDFREVASRASRDDESYCCEASRRLGDGRGELGQDTRVFNGYDDVRTSEAND